MAPENNQPAAGQKFCGSESCNLFYGLWDDHALCRKCRICTGSRSDPCEVCKLWEDDMWDKWKVTEERSIRHKQRKLESRMAGETKPIFDSAQFADPYASLVESEAN